MLFNLLIPLLSGLGSSAAAVVLKALANWYEARQKLQSTDEQSFRNALASDSLSELGGYLDNAIGKFSIGEYSQNRKVRSRVNDFFSRLEDYVGKRAEVTSPQVAPPKVERVIGAIDSELDAVESRIQQGAVWDGLAALRRIIERRLTTLASQNGITLPERLGAGKMLRLLHQKELLPNEVFEELKFAIDVANRGVHGLDVESDEALEASQNARAAFSTLPLVHA
jgi:hypothetical protein